MWILVRKELLSHLLTLRLAVAFACTVGLVTLVTVIGSLDFSARMAEYRDDAQEVEAKLEAATVWSQVQPDVNLPPQPLSVFALGIEAWVGNATPIRIYRKDEARQDGEATMISDDVQKSMSSGSK